ncbi:sporulation protein YqfD [Paenibacillus sp. JX-17]|uniref:Sporulation protein YqfD n=1 Tax=Paenibacillus lacisoli TaxID=3064525 RepID=A0ABT9CBV5_9BACL|nr:sporulation protein YqfD [Paenibacillus sp. JX-17]MDO7905457.1 sporulation protein YqfD [Paenibacillus sp. JX-17]
MKSPTLSTVRGSVVIVVTGGRVEELMNLLAAEHIVIWNVRALAAQKAEMQVLLSDFFRLRPLLRRTGCRMKVSQRNGLPFVWLRLRKRSFFTAGILIFFVTLYFLSSMVWDVKVEGNSRLTTDEVLRAARAEGIYPFQWEGRLAPQDKLAKQLALRLPGVSWIGVSKEGTTVKIEIVEAKEPQKAELLNPRHLISTADAVVTHIYAEQGRPVVAQNMRVKKGAILISGTLGDEENSQTVVAKGEVKGLVWHEYNLEVPLTHRTQVYTGESKEKLYLVLGSRAIQLWGYGKDPYESSKVVTELDPLTWRSYKLPVGWMTEKVMENSTLEEKLTPQQAKNEALAAAHSDILAKNGKGTKIMSQKILHEKTENGKVYMKVLFEVEQNITGELPLVHNQGE